MRGAVSWPVLFGKAERGPSGTPALCPRGAHFHSRCPHGPILASRSEHRELGEPVPPPLLFCPASPAFLRWVTVACPWGLGECRVVAGWFGWAVSQMAERRQAGAHVSVCALCPAPGCAEPRTGRVRSAPLLMRTLPGLPRGQHRARAQASPGRDTRESLATDATCPCCAMLPARPPGQAVLTVVQAEPLGRSGSLGGGCSLETKEQAGVCPRECRARGQEGPEALGPRGSLGLMGASGLGVGTR